MGIVLAELGTTPCESPDRRLGIGTRQGRKVYGGIAEAVNLVVEITRRSGPHTRSQYSDLLGRGGRSILIQMIRILHGSNI